MGPCYGTLRGSHRYPGQSVLDPMTLNGSEVVSFPAYLCSYRLTNSDQIRHGSPRAQVCNIVSGQSRALT